MPLGPVPVVLAAVSVGKVVTPVSDPEIEKTETVPEVGSLNVPWLATKRNLPVGSTAKATGFWPAAQEEQDDACKLPSEFTLYAPMVLSPLLTRKMVL